MKICNLWLMGGLGNVLFQAYAGRILKSKGINVRLIGNLVENNFATRLAHWKIHAPIFRNYIEDEVLHKSNGPALIAFALKKLGVSSKKYIFYNKLSDISDLPENFELFGYFQDKNLIENNKNCFESFTSDLLKKIPEQNSIEQVVHLRFGDRLNDKEWLKNHGIYYEKICSIITQSRKMTYVVTDSQEHARSFLGNKENIFFPNTRGPVDDFNLICNAETLFLSPSTFSWWGAHINKNCKQVYLPASIYSELGYHNGNVNIVVI